MVKSISAPYLSSKNLLSPTSDRGNSTIGSNHLSVTLAKDRDASTKQLNEIEKIKEKEKKRFEKHLRVASENNKKLEQKEKK